MSWPGVVRSVVPLVTALAALVLPVAPAGAQVPMPGGGGMLGGVGAAGAAGGAGGPGAKEVDVSAKSIDTSDAPPSDKEKVRAFPLAEPFLLGPEPGVGPIKAVYVSRPGILAPSEPDGKSLVVKALGKRLGTVQVTLVGAAGMKSFPVKIVPDIKFVRQAVADQFPLANVRLTPAGDNVIVVEGFVDSPIQVEQINNFVRQFVETGGRVINAIRVTGVSQVQLEVCIARVDRSALRNLGVNFLAGGRRGFVGSQVGNLIGVPSINTAGVTPGTGPIFTNFATATASTTGVLQPESTIFFGATSANSSLFGFIEALKQEGLAKVLATPTLVTVDNRPADFLVGGEQPYPTISTGGTGLVVPSTEFKPFGTRLTFVPVILGEGKIRMSVIPEVSRPTANTVNIGGINVPAFETQRVNATVEMETGQTLALGGLLETQEDATVNKVPVLGDLPCVGTLFRRTTINRVETELLILVTPRLVDAMGACQRPAVLPGQETRSPSDCELYLKGKLEVPAPPPGPPPEPLPLGGYPAGQSGAAPAPAPVVPASYSAPRR